MPVPSQGHYDFHSFPVVDWFCLFIYLWVLTFPMLDCSEFGNFVITLIHWVLIMIFNRNIIFFKHINIISLKENFKNGKEFHQYQENNNLLLLHWFWCMLLWQLFYLFCSSIVINTVIVTAGNFEPYWKREVWRFKIWFNPPFL